MVGLLAALGVGILITLQSEHENIATTVEPTRMRQAGLAAIAVVGLLVALEVDVVTAEGGAAKEEAEAVAAMEVEVTLEVVRFSSATPIPIQEKT